MRSRRSGNAWRRSSYASNTFSSILIAPRRPTRCGESLSRNPAHKGSPTVVYLLIALSVSFVLLVAYDAHAVGRRMVDPRDED